MKKIAYVTGITLVILMTEGVANELDELNIKIVDESAKSALFQREKIVGCTDFVEKKELSCSKEPKDAILSKLPSSKQLEESDLEDDDTRENMKNQLRSILKELTQLRKEQQANRRTIENLKEIIAVLSDKRTKHNSQNILKVKNEIKRITPRKSRSVTKTLVRKKIKEISRTDTAVIIEVQNNESLSTYAQAYYNDNRKYYRIYRANKNKIPKSMMIIIGDRLTIPLD